MGKDRGGKYRSRFTSNIEKRINYTKIVISITRRSHILGVIIFLGVIMIEKGVIIIVEFIFNDAPSKQVYGRA